MELKAKKRTILGKKVKDLRKSGFIPAVAFGKNLVSRPITLDLKEFEKVYKEVGESRLVDLTLEGEKPMKVLISGINVHPVSEKILHANLHQVSLTEEITTEVPIEIVGESPAVASGEGIVLTLLPEVEVTCLPQDLPSEIPVDISKLKKIDDAVAIKDLRVAQNKVKINVDPEELVLKIGYAKMAEEEEEVAKEAELLSEVEVEREKTREEEEKGGEASPRP